MTEQYDASDAESHARLVINRMMADMDAFRVTGDIDAFLPNSMSMLCNTKYCPALGTETCRAHRPAKED